MSIKKYADSVGLTEFWAKVKAYVANAVKVTGVKGNAESSYRTGNVNLTPANIGALALSGGTLTNNLTIQKASDNRIYQKSTTIDITKANNNLAANVNDVMYLQRVDKNGNRVGDIYNRTEGTDAGARSCTVIRATNKKSDGTDVNNAMEIQAKKDGSLTYAVSNPKNFRSAIRGQSTLEVKRFASTSSNYAGNKTFTFTKTANYRPIMLGYCYASGHASVYLTDVFIGSYTDAGTSITLGAYVYNPSNLPDIQCFFNVLFMRID